MSDLSDAIENIKRNPLISADSLIYVYQISEPIGYVLVPVGSLDTQSALIFQNLALQLVLAMDSSFILVVDLAKLAYVSSTGFGSLTSLLIQCKKKNLLFYLTGLSPKTKQLMDILGFTAFFNYLDEYRLVE